MALKRVRVAVAGVVVTALGTTLAWFALPRGDEPSSAAASSCAHVRATESLIRANALSDRVFAELRSAVDASARAAEEDPVWVRLASGVQTLEYSLRNDDPDASRVGLELVRSICAEVQW